MHSIDKLNPRKGTQVHDFVTISHSIVHTVQLCVFANRLASACMQYATSARGRIADVKTKSSARTNTTILPPTILL